MSAYLRPPKHEHWAMHIMGKPHGKKMDTCSSTLKYSSSLKGGYRNFLFYSSVGPIGVSANKVTAEPPPSNPRFCQSAHESSTLIIKVCTSVQTAHICASMKYGEMMCNDLHLCNLHLGNLAMQLCLLQMWCLGAVQICKCGLNVEKWAPNVLQMGTCYDDFTRIGVTVV